MDPNANLEEIRRLIESLREDTFDREDDISDDVLHLLDLVESLDRWICRGGFLPSEWLQSRLG